MVQKTKKTPMMEQYEAMKAKYPDAFLFFRLGDFYELFNDDALKAAQLLEITLTSRNKNAENPIPMCGVPYHAAGDYIRQLIRLGYKVAIAEQMEDPKQAKGMVRREVIRLITPGTYLEEGSQQRNNYICSLLQSKSGYALAHSDLGTGELQVTQLTSLESLLTEFAQLQPSELVVETEPDEDFLDKLKRLADFTLSVYSPDPAAIEDQDQLLTAIEGADERAALTLLLAYVQATQFQMVDHWQEAEHYEVDHYLHLDHYAKRNLELTESIRTRQQANSLLAFLNQTRTAMGSRLLRQWLDRPLIIAADIERRQNCVADLMDQYFVRLEIQEQLKGVYDLERLVAKISMGSVNARELLQLKQSLAKVPAIVHNLQLLLAEDEDRQAHWQGVLESLTALPEVVDLIDRAIDPDANVQITEGDIIRDGFNDQLDHYRDAMRHGKAWIAKLQADERERTGIKSLKVGYNKVFGYYIEVTKANLHLLDDLEENNYERKQTLANAERYITPELKEMERTLLEAEDKSIDLEYQLFIQVRDQVKAYKQDLQALAKSVASLDVLQSFAQISEDYQFVRPEISLDDRNLEIIDSRHPVVEAVIGKDQFVPNSIEMDDKTNVLLITGPNMSGKSTYMRQLALIVIMAQMGCDVPAKSAKMPIFDQIFTRIGAADDLISGQSTFMVEMLEANQAIQYATDRSLLLFDEIGRGTSTYDGIALAQAILEYLHDHLEAKLLFSTHYHELTSLEDSLPGLRNIHVGASEKDGELVFLHKIFPGPADRSYGIHVAKLAGMPKSLLANADRILKDLQASHGEDQGEQLSLFSVAETSPRAEDPTATWVMDQLDQVDLNDTTPMQAFELLRKLVAKVEGGD
ncbi:DNA mismatch repair protein MutS [Aerococcus sanguinicola]|uniref:DNA mismatch repair protein MutS n=1 Tax=Aerococcus sanguinicola TaxID=119206 RepID=A0A0X8F9W5_9LACT|nr:DNA mismatch repair protein MutS [Aerococcus sanguinicola]AMB93466.1 DNA mismatch repair protein MutS [Aerococcus sanguinicola]MDK7051000.1 DNA mismatch repair protein MutS [Aerococcus sanguinicola]